MAAEASAAPAPAVVQTAAKVAFPSHPLHDASLNGIAQWTTSDKRVVLKRGKWLTLQEHTVHIPPPPVSAAAAAAAAADGKAAPAPAPKSIGDWTWVESPHFINVLCVTRDDKWLVFAQPKYAVGVLMQQNSFAPVGGYLEPGEDPLRAAQRELREETGYESDRWVPLCSGVADANRGCGVGHLFLALDATFAGKTESDDLEEQRPLWLSTDELEGLLHANAFKAHSWAATVALSLLHWRKHKEQQQQQRQAAVAAEAKQSAAAKATPFAASTATTGLLCVGAVAAAVALWFTAARK